jgi:hypothetical protein
MRDAFALPMRTISIVVLSGARVSSGEPKSAYLYTCHLSLLRLASGTG